MESMLLATDASINNIKYFDFVLRYTNGPNIGEIVTKDNFPENGIDIRIPYPEGTDAHNYIFTILHIKQDGSSEFLNGRTLSDSILFHTDSLSPFALGWTGENAAKPLSNCKFGTVLPEQYTGNELKPPVYIYSNGKLLSKENYTLTYSNNINAGTATIIAEGKGDYTGTISKSFQILPVAIDKTTINLEKTSCLYNGAEIKPNITIVDGNKTLSKDDYTITFRNNINAGTATITITGKGNYSGSINKTFTIEKRKNTITASNMTKTTSSKKQVFSIKAKTNNGAKLSYKSNNKKITVSNTGKVTIAKNYVGEATITITFADSKNNSNTSKKVKVTVIPKSVSISSLKNTNSKRMTLKWKRNKDITGYQVAYSTTNNFKKSITKNVKSNKTVNLNIPKLTKNKKYYVRIRTYKKVSGKTYYSSWSKSKQIKITK